MRIIYFHQYFSTPKGKAGIRSYYFAKKLADSGNDVFVICLNDSRTDCGLKGEFTKGFRKGKVEGINIIQLDIKYSNSISFIYRGLIFLKYTLRGIKLAFKIKPELIIATSTPLTVTIPGIIMRWFYGTPFIFEVRDLWPKLPIAMGILKNKFIIIILKFLEKLSYKSADFIIGLAPGICSEIEKENISKDKIMLIPNISDINLIKSSNNSVNKNPLKLRNHDNSITKSSLIAAFTGAHGLANGLENLLEVALELKKLKRDDIKILFIGEGATKKSLIKKAKKLDLKNCVFIDSIPKKELSKILKESVHLGLMILKNIPEFYNGTSPNKFFDYLACGLPVITNYPGWLDKMIDKNKLGFVVPPNDKKAFANKLIEIAENKNSLKELSKNCVHYGSNNFNPEILSSKFLNIVNKTYSKFKYRQNNFLINSLYDCFKSIIDKLLAIFLILILSPLLILISIIVFLNLGLPIFFVQKRPGLNNKIFKLIKFRSMKNSLVPTNETDYDSKRLNSFGKFFRSTSLDELPELINIIKGDMSFIGPRPLLIEYLKLYNVEQAKRHNVKPGITGLAQIKGRNLLSWEERFELDLYYVKNRNLLLDVKILLITFIKVIRRDGINSQNSVSSKKFTGSNKKELDF